MPLNHYISLIHVQALMKLKAQANLMVLSYLWWILEPLLYVLLFYFVFKFILYRGGDDFLIFLILGKIPFLWFSKSVISGANSLLENKGLISARKISKAIFPLINCQESLYKQVVAFIVMLAATLIAGFEISVDWWQLLVIITIQYLLICGVAAVFCVFVTYAPDFNVIIQMFMMGLMFTSGIFWDVNLIQDPQVKSLLLILNPLAAIIDAYRQVLMYGNHITAQMILPVFAWAVVAIFTGFFAIHKLNNGLTRRLIT